MVRAGESKPFAEIEWTDAMHAAAVTLITAVAVCFFEMLGFLTTMVAMMFVLLVAIERRPLLHAALFPQGPGMLANPAKFGDFVRHINPADGTDRQEKVQVNRKQRKGGAEKGGTSRDVRPTLIGVVTERLKLLFCSHGSNNIGMNLSFSTRTRPTRTRLTARLQVLKRNLPIRGIRRNSIAPTKAWAAR